MSEIGANSLFLEHIGIMPKHADHMIVSVYVITFMEANLSHDHDLQTNLD